ncbi:DnaD domain protein [Faecalicatena sp. AGMB00832]|uniref:DnaD domain protein n=1 Tax=Faecalicatena faecalis TaxID=2726362 RepID=A0ABS6CY96_9FIRM|nr:MULTISPECIES: DnaD domain protein [Faecalicatena]MBU3874295.1 DnaD domain protein [Faecalicatena faecalis]MCI6464586.1 DnaD domain protein [Faecalicatena sp.]MDY5620906.1 DnaD domain protein [Lachnospiraceae bacterium]
MKTLTLKNKFQTNVTLIANDFIDNYMINANGEFIKVYLFLLRHLDDPCSNLTITTIADCLNNTENDVLRAFRYWESEGLLSLEKDEDGKIIGIEMDRTPSITHRKMTAPKVTAIPERPAFKEVTAVTDTPVVREAVAITEAPVLRNVSAAPEASLIRGVATVPGTTILRQVEAMPEAPVFEEVKPVIEQQAAPKAKAIPLTSFKAQKEIKSLLFIAEQYLGKTLSKTDVDAITYFYETLGMSADLIEYLIESCVENGHKSIHYIQKVALSWSDSGVTTIEQARQQSANYNRNCYTVLNAFGIKNRGPAATELIYIKKWTEELGFDLDIIQEACSRTIIATHQPSFEYTDTILRKWHENGVRHLKDVAVLDAAYQKEKAARSTASSRQKPVSKNLNNFERRAYDMDSLEEQLLNSN